jgi:hypothetical protein
VVTVADGRRKGAPALLHRLLAFEQEGIPTVEKLVEQHPVG